MTDTVRKLILRVLDYVERTPGSSFSIARWRDGIWGYSHDAQLYFNYHCWDGVTTHFISRDGDPFWSCTADLTEDNLKYLLSQLEEEK